MSIDMAPQQQEAASPRVLVVRSFLRYSTLETLLADQPLFDFESSDALAQFSVWIAPAMATPIALGLAQEFGVLTWHSFLVGFATIISLILAIVAGLRARVVVFRDCVVVERKWFSLRYRVHKGSQISHVVFGGDWGDDYGAHGVVLDLDGREVHIGNTKNMHLLHDELNRLVVAQKRQANALFQETPSK